MKNPLIIPISDNRRLVVSCFNDMFEVAIELKESDRLWNDGTFIRIPKSEFYLFLDAVSRIEKLLLLR